MTKLITATAAREMLGGISDMSLWRWLHDPSLGFPQPVYIAGRRYFRASEIEDWIVSQETSQGAA